MAKVQKKKVSRKKKASKKKTPKKKTSKKKGSRAGRKPLFVKSMCTPAQEAAKMGLNDKQIAKIIGVSAKSVSVWQLEHEGFGKAVKAGRRDFETDKIEQSLRQQALPHSDITITEEFEPHKRKDGLKLLKRTRRVRKKVVSIVAARTVLAAEMPERYVDKHRVVHGITTELASLMDIIDGSSKGTLPDQDEISEAG